jgi:hypothetical protein
MKYFILDKEILKDINKWKREQKSKDSSNYISGERWTYMFTPGGLGTIIEVRDNILNEIKDFTDYNLFG